MSDDKHIILLLFIIQLNSIKLHCVVLLLITFNFLGPSSHGDVPVKGEGVYERDVAEVCAAACLIVCVCVCVCVCVWRWLKMIQTSCVL